MQKIVLFVLSACLAVAAVHLSDEERAWIKANPVIKVHNEMKWAPFNFNENGQPKGMSIDTMNLIAKRVGLQVEYISGPSWNEFVEMIKTGELDVMLNIVQNDARDKFMLFTTVFQLVPHCIVTREDSPYKYSKYEDILNKTVAVEDGFVTHDYIAKTSPNTKLVLRKDTLGALQAVSFGEADLTVGILATEAHAIKSNGLNNLKIIGVSDDKLFAPKELKIAVSKNQETLRNILQKGLDSLSDEEKKQIQDRWVDVDLEGKTDWFFIFKIISIFIVIISVIGYYLYKMVKLKTELSASNNFLQHAMDELEELHNQTQDSINYASLIQHSITPKNALFRKFFGDYFILWYPKDVVGGDIYFFEEIRDGEALLIVADCTGHGVPGAFVTMMVKALEREVVSDLKQVANPNVARILEKFNRNMKSLLKQDNKDALSNAGFDAVVLYINKNSRTIKFAGANLPLYVVKNNKLEIIRGDRESVGYRSSKSDYKFTEHTIEFDEKTVFYISTDGYIDQNGGRKGLPFGRRRFANVINEYHAEAMADQQEVFLDALYGYQKKELRNDDITLIGFRTTTLEEK